MAACASALCLLCSSVFLLPVVAAGTHPNPHTTGPFLIRDEGGKVMESHELDDNGMLRMPVGVTSVIVEPHEGQKIELTSPNEYESQVDMCSYLVPHRLLRGESQTVDLRGIAYSGGGRGIVRVDVSGDGGQNWVEATLEEV